jgi:SWI/SNF-related matrix-associated actin-dependent regulator 1 of chromatin subfamily A
MKQHLAMLEKSRAVSSNIDIPAPPGLTYLPYQKAGVAYALQRKDTLIGDEPGLGKTIQALGFINKTKPKNVIVVAPVTLAFNWKLEAEKWLIDPYEIFIPKTGADEIPATENGLFVITNYEKLVGSRSRSLIQKWKFRSSKNDPKAIEKLKELEQKLLVLRNLARSGDEKAASQVSKIEEELNLPVTGESTSNFCDSLRRIWDIAIFDEAQAIKNPQSKRSQAVLGEEGLVRRSRRTLFLTGTPIENYPKEIWPVAATICPAKFGDWWAFARRYCGLHTEVHNNRKVYVTTGSSHLSELQQRLRSSFMVRRLKHDVLKELPPKRRQLVVLGDETIDWNSHPDFQRWKKLYESQYEAALARLEASKTLGEYKKALKDLQATTGVAFTEMSEFRHKTALAKLPLCLKYIDDLLATEIENVVIFAHHQDVLEKIHEHYKESSCLLYGNTPMEKRGDIVKQFQDGHKRIFIGGLKPAGTGITLTRASTVIFIEIDWVPAVLSQAEDRLCRIGQKKMVHVIHLVLNNTLDVNMSKKVIAKQDIIDKALDRLPEHIRLKHAV